MSGAKNILDKWYNFCYVNLLFRISHDLRTEFTGRIINKMNLNVCGFSDVLSICTSLVLAVFMTLRHGCDGGFSSVYCPVFFRWHKSVIVENS